MRSHYSGTCAFEVKVCKKGAKRIPESALKPHQKAALMDAASKSGIVYKLTDEARRQQPFDGFKLAGVEAYVIVCFDDIRIGIRVQDWCGATRETVGAFTF